MGDPQTVPLHEILVAEPRTADVDAAHPDRQHVVEHSGALVLEMDTGRQGLDPALADRAVAAGELLEVGDARDLEPDHVRRVMGDALRVRLGKPDADVVRERKAVHM